MAIDSARGGSSPGSLALALVNSVDWRFDPRNRADKLGSYAALLELCAEKGEAGSPFRDGPDSSPSPLRAALLDEALRSPTSAAEALVAVKAFREGLFALLRAAAAGEEPPAGALAALDPLLAEARLSETLVWSSGAFSLAPRRAEESLDAALRSIARDAEALLLSPLLSRIRLCAAPECGWVFMDLSKSGKRRWCEMRSCGNREKARRHRERAASARPGERPPPPDRGIGPT